MIHLVYIKVTVGAVQVTALAFVAHMQRQAVRQLADGRLAEGALLLLCALRAGAEMTLAVLIGEAFSTAVGAAELAHVEHVHDLPRHLHLLELLLAERADRVPREPLVQTRAADEALAVAARREVLQHVRADGADELLQHFFELGLRVLDRQFFQLVRRGHRPQPLVHRGDELDGPRQGL